MSLALTTRPDSLIATVCDACQSENTRIAYRGHLGRFLDWNDGAALNRDTVQAYRTYLREEGRGASTINQALAAIRKLAHEAYLHNAIDDRTWWGIKEVQTAKLSGTRVGNWLTLEQVRRLLRAGDTKSLQGLRDRAIVATLFGCALRRAELASLTVKHLQYREDRPVIVDLLGKGGKIRPVPMPVEAYERVKAWLEAAGIVQGAVFLALRGPSVDFSAPMGARGVYSAVERVAARADFEHWCEEYDYNPDSGSRIPELKYRECKELEKWPEVALSPHDLRRTAARIMYQRNGRNLLQVRLILGHADTRTTEKYIGLDVARLKKAANDGLDVW